MMFLIEATPTTAGHIRTREYRAVERGVYEYYLHNGVTNNSTPREPDQGGSSGD